ncbi:MAG: hypothetical protein ACYTA3_11790 [Planctomycetota bacterium]|jgi:hypothetical protein
MRTQRLKELQAAIHAIEGGWHEAGGMGPGATALAEGQAVRHGLPLARRTRASVYDKTRQSRGTHSWCMPPGGVHEWFGVAHAAHSWAPPLGILLHLALRSLEGSPGCVVWIGRRCWPYPHVLNGAGLRRSIFVDPPDGASRLWTIDLAARCPGVAGGHAVAGALRAGNGQGPEMDRRTAALQGSAARVRGPPDHGVEGCPRRCRCTCRTGRPT